jgi:hypothetical protein
MSMIAPPAVLSILMPAIDECAGKGNRASFVTIIFINRYTLYKHKQIDLDKEELCQTSFNFVKCSYAVNPKVSIN